MHVSIGTPLQSSAFKVLLLGAGELGKEVVISLQRLGVEVHAADRYDHAPAMQVAHFSYTLNMADANELNALIDQSIPFYKKALETDPKYIPSLESLKIIYGFKADTKNYEDISKRLKEAQAAAPAPKS